MGKDPAANRSGASATGVAEPFPAGGNQAMDAAAAPGDDKERSAEAQSATPRSGGYADKVAARQPGFFEVYKPSQGYYTRLGTGVFFGVLILWAAHFAWEQMGAFQDATRPWTLYLRYGVPVALLIGLGLVLYWLACVNRRAVDFFIATEGEMKKVSWSSRKEVIGSTKVVIGTVILMGTLLFVVDMAFLVFFRWIGVLKH